MPVKTHYSDVILGDGSPAVAFNIQTNKGMTHGVFSQNRIWVHGIEGIGSVKGLMNVLTRKYNCREITFTPLINDNVKNSIRGTVKTCKKDDPDNPYKEDFEYLETTWET